MLKQNIFFFKALIQAFPLSRLTALSPEVPPKTTKTFFKLFFYSPIILISSSRLIPVFSLTLRFTFCISFSMSADFAFPLLTKKLQCFFEITASPSLNSSLPVSLINCHAFLLLAFLKVLPHVLI